MMPRLRDAWLGELNLYAATSLRMRRAADVAGSRICCSGPPMPCWGRPGSKVLMGQATVAMTP